MQLPDGWIEHDGGPCPVPGDAPTAVLLRNGARGFGAANVFLGWCHTDSAEPAHVIAYKPEPHQ